MDKNNLNFNGKAPLINVCNPNLKRAIGLTVFAVHANQGLGVFACDISMEVSELNTATYGSSTPLNALNGKAVTLLKNGADKIQAQIDELTQHHQRLVEQVALIESGEIDIEASALAQQQAHWADYSFKK